MKTAFSRLMDYIRVALLITYIVVLSACSAFRPRGDYADEKETGVRTMVAPILAFRDPHGQAEKAARAECVGEKKTYHYEKASGVRNNIIQYRCLSRASAADASQSL